MMVWNADGVLDFVSEFSGHKDFGQHRTLAVIDADGNLKAGIVFHDWQPDYGTIEFSIVTTGPKWITRGVLAEIGRYSFDVAGCQALIARTDGENTRARRLFLAAGAKEYIIPRMRGRAASEAIMMLTDDAWASSKLNRPSDEIKFTSAAA